MYFAGTIIYRAVACQIKNKSAVGLKACALQLAMHKRINVPFVVGNLLHLNGINALATFFVQDYHKRQQAYYKAGEVKSKSLLECHIS